MTKRDLIRKIQEKYQYYSKEDMSYAVNVIFNSMVSSLKRNERIEIRGFGVLTLKHRQPRKGRNPKTGKIVDVKERKMPFLKAGKELKERINDSQKTI